MVSVYYNFFTVYFANEFAIIKELCNTYNTTDGLFKVAAVSHFNEIQGITKKLIENNKVLNERNFFNDFNRSFKNSIGNDCYKSVVNRTDSNFILHSSNYTDYHQLKGYVIDTIDYNYHFSIVILFCIVGGILIIIIVTGYLSFKRSKTYVL